MQKVFICEDDQIQQKQIELVVRNYIMIEELEMELCMSTHNPQEILLYLEKHSDTKGVFFLDIDLKQELNGIQLGRQIRDKCIDCKIIFITTHNELLPLTFKYKVEAMDYIAKDDLEQMNQRIREALVQAQKHYTANNRSTTDRIKLKVGNRIRVFLVSEIMYFITSTSPHKIELHLRNGTIDFYGKMEEIEPLSEHFVRVHHSTIVNVDQIASIDRKKRKLFMSNGEVCYASVRMIRNIKLKGTEI